MRNNPFVRRFGAFALIASLAGLLAGCDEPSGFTASSSRAAAPVPPQTLALMAAKGTTKNAPVLIRAYKKEAELEIWKMKSDGRYALLKTFPMCRWSGQLGPKTREGDRQVPEGFYSITPAQMNPKSAYYLSFNVGYPNAYDRSHGRGGGSIMVHGVCSSAGCFSMTDPQIGEIYAIAREGFAGGQRAIQMQSYPFRMTAENLAKYRLDPNIAFWRQLKEGADNFEVTQQEVAVGVCNKRYVFNATPADGSRFEASAACPPLRRNDETRSAVAAKERRDELKIAELAAQGVRPMRTVYADGGQHPDFAWQASYASRPEALARGPIDIALDEGKGKKSRLSPAVQLAALKTETAAAPAAKPQSSDQAQATAETSEEPAKPQLSLFSRFFGAKSADPEPEAPTVAAINGPAISQSARVPVPPKRTPPASTAAKPQASLSSAPVKRQAPRPAKHIDGAALALPTSFAAIAQAAR
jgi:murein L,D-transpeptidase YafK